MVKAIKSKMVIFNGNHISIEEGREFPKESPIVLRNKSLFEDVVEAKKTTKIKKTTKKQKKVELKEELLVEAPIAEAEVIIED